MLGYHCLFTQIIDQSVSRAVPADKLEECTALRCFWVYGEGRGKANRQRHSRRYVPPLSESAYQSDLELLCLPIGSRRHLITRN